ncbi:N-acetylmuramoyl-L-alanine amidase [Streptomyces sp. KR55]|uniref:N-acetylmuramoyl-L-alanine amidase n=1 Tax=Streptomyces sp. KR55 TaxID=3457425 RepID=UPI003FD34AF5
MAPPLSPDRFLTILRAEGLTVIEHGDWRNHNRNHKGPWGPMHGVMIHHTVTRGHDYTVDICRRGYGSLPGPLCHGVICKQGHVHLVGYGRANHAGLGDDDVLRAVIAEQDLPPDNEANTDGNRHFYGFECENLGDGEDPWPPEQLLAIEKVGAALAREHGWTERSVIGHLEWQPGKVDPRGFTMASMRSRIAARLDDNPQQEDDMPLTTEDKAWISGEIRDAIKELVAVEVLTKDGIIDNPNPDTADTNAYISMETSLRNIEIVARRADKTSADVKAKVDSLSVGSVSPDALAEILADKLAARLSS